MSNGRKIQVITGGTSGMGKAAAIALGKFGPVLIGGRSEKKLAEAMEEIRAKGVEVFGKVCDVSDIGSVKAFADYARASRRWDTSFTRRASIPTAAIPSRS